MNILLPVQIVDATGAVASDQFGLRTVSLPRVPIAGEQFEVAGYVATVENVRWYWDGRVRVRLVGTHVPLEVIERMEAEGWQVVPWEDEPPSEWLG